VTNFNYQNIIYFRTVFNHRKDDIYFVVFLIVKIWKI